MKDTVRQFAESHRLRARRDKCGDGIVPGKYGHIYDHGNGRFGIVLEDPADRPSRSRALLARRRKALAAGFIPHQLAEVESILLFDPKDAKQVRLAIRLVGCRPKRILSPAERAVLIARLEKARIPRKSLQNAEIAL